MFVAAHELPELYGGAWMEPLLSINDVARLLGVSRGTVYALIRRGEINPLRVGERARFSLGEIRRYLAG